MLITGNFKKVDSDGKVGRGGKKLQEPPCIFSELSRQKEVSLSSFVLRGQSQEVGESRRGKHRVDGMENILTIEIGCISCYWRQVFLRGVEEIQSMWTVRD